MTHPIPDHAGRGAAAHLRFWNLLPALRAAVLGLALSLTALAYAGPKWDPIDPADLAATESTSSPGADAEILFARHELEEEGFEAETQAYVRAKIYTAKGVEDRGKLSIRSYGTSKVTNVYARVVKADGTIYELKKDDIFETTVWKTRNLKEKVTRFAFPNLAPGDIVEYRWRHTGQGAAFMRWLYVQEEVPVREFRYVLAAVSGQTYISWLNCNDVDQTKRGGRLTVTIRNVPAWKGEEFMPPDREFRGWLFMVKTLEEENHERLWKILNREIAEDFGYKIAPAGPVKEKARQLIEGAVDDEEKLRRLYEFCQSEITNFSYIETAELQAQREKSLTADDQSPKATLARKYGWHGEINMLFASLARAAGFEVRKSLNAGIDEVLTVQTPRGWAFLNSARVAIQVGGAWRFFDPGNYLVPFSMMDWRDEGATALVCEKTDKTLQFAEVPRSQPSDSRAARRGTFELSDDGTLEGDVEITWTGHLARSLKGENWTESQENVDKEFREDINKRLPGAEITGLTWENLRTRDLPLKARYHVVIPGYAEQVGRRLLVRPGYFEAGAYGIFTAPERRYPIAFTFGWQEFDEVSIKLPEGYELDQPSAPRPVGQVDEMLGSTYKIKYGTKSRTLSYAREFSLGRNGAVMFQAQSYPALKTIFEDLHRSDTHAIMIKPKAAAEVKSGPEATASAAQ